MTPRLGRWLGGSVVVVGLMVVLFGFLAWATVTLDGGSPSTLTGWGTISGAESAVGQNINDVITSLQGTGSYRPALLPTVLGGAAVLPGVWIAVRRSKFAAAGVVALGLFIGAWGLYRALRPGDIAGLLVAGDVSTAAVGPWATCFAGAAIIGPAVAVLILPAPPPPGVRRSRGIQPRR
ncbi:MAG: hypothetical protein ABIR83_04280 [Nakamurella sp.]